VRINVYISSAGYCSRRRADRYIKEGHVTINGERATLWSHVQEGDEVRVLDEVIHPREHTTYVMLNKPRGIICTAAQDVPGNVIECINYPERIFPIGRLDNQSEGLLLLTNDGPIVNDLLKKEAQVEKEYVVTVNREITPDFIKGLAVGVSIYNPRVKGHTTTSPCKVTQLNDYQFSIVLIEGLNRQIRRMCRRFQYTVTHLQRVRMKHLQLGDLPIGEWRYLTEEEIHGLKG